MGAQSDSKVVPIVDLTPQGSGTGMTRLSQFYKDNFVAVLKRVEEYPTIVVSVTGLFRSGKSFLVNLMITFLEHLQKVGYLWVLPKPTCSEQISLHLHDILPSGSAVVFCLHNSRITGVLYTR